MDKNRPKSGNTKVASSLNKVYSCDICGKTLKLRTSYKKHMNNHQGKRHQCGSCDKVFASYTGLSHHKRSHETSAEARLPYPCPACDKRFLTESKCRRHSEAVHRGTKVHKDDACTSAGKEVPSIDKDIPSIDRDVPSNDKDANSLEKDGKDFPNIGKDIGSTCEDNSDGKDSSDSKDNNDGKDVRKSFNIGKDVASIVKDDKPSSLSCKICSKTFGTMSNLKRHILKHQGQRFSCHLCGKTYSVKESLNTHLKWHEIGEPWSCDKCDARFIYKHSLKRHQQRVHDRKENSESIGRETTVQDKASPADPDDWSHLPAVKPSNKLVKRNSNVKMFRCKVCNKLFSGRNSLQTHLGKHLGKTYDCDVCDKKLTSSHSLKTHKMIHENVKPYICGMCGAQFISRFKLIRHEMTHVPRERQIICEICGKGFFNAEYLKSHKKVHDDVKAHPCPTCGQSFKHAASLNTHKRIHDTERKFKCSFCTRGFDQKRTLENHLKLHKGQSTVKKGRIAPPVDNCQICGLGLSSKRGLQKHLKKHREGSLIKFNKKSNRNFTVVRSRGVEEVVEQDSENRRVEVKSKVVPDKLIANVHYERVHTEVYNQDKNDTLAPGYLPIGNSQLRYDCKSLFRETCNHSEDEKPTSELSKMKSGHFDKVEKITAIENKDWKDFVMKSSDAKVFETYDNLNNSSVNSVKESNREPAEKRRFISSIRESNSRRIEQGPEFIIQDKVKQEPLSHFEDKSEDVDRVANDKTETGAHNLENSLQGIRQIKTATMLSTVNTVNSTVAKENTLGMIKETHVRLRDQIDLQTQKESNNLINSKQASKVDDVDLTAVKELPIPNPSCIDGLGMGKSFTNDEITINYTSESDSAMDTSFAKDKSNDTSTNPECESDNASEVGELFINSDYDSDATDIIEGYEVSENKDWLSDGELEQTIETSSKSLASASNHEDQYHEELEQSVEVNSKSLASASNHEDLGVKHEVHDLQEDNDKGMLGTSDNKTAVDQGFKQDVDELEKRCTSGKNTYNNRAKDTFSTPDNDNETAVAVEVKDEISDDVMCMKNTYKTISASKSNGTLDLDQSICVQAKNYPDVTNRVVPDETAPVGAVSSGSTLSRCTDRTCNNSAMLKESGNLLNSQLGLPARTLRFRDYKCKTKTRVEQGGKIQASHEVEKRQIQDETKETEEANAAETEQDLPQAKDKCDICHKVFKLHAYLRKHMKNHHPNKEIVYKCRNGDCGESFTSKRQYRQHLLSHNEVACQLCCKKYKNTNELIVHVQIKHDTIGEKLDYDRVTCMICNDVFEDGLDALEHFKSHKVVKKQVNKSNEEKNKVYKCDQCTKTFQKKQSLVRHKVIHRKEECPTCEKCGRVFTQTVHMLRHIRSNACSKNFTCFHCKQKFHTAGQLRVHRKSEHREQSYECPFCHKRFSSSSNMHRHKQLHVGGAGGVLVTRPYMCSICGSCYTASHSLKIHMTTHTGTRPHVCETCGASYKQRAHLLRHIAVSHTGIRKFKCEEHGCGKAFPDKQALRTHGLSHSGERPHKCLECGKSFSQSQILKVHMKTHLETKEHVCVFCKQEFSTKMSLQRHIKRHDNRYTGSTHNDRGLKKKRRLTKMSDKQFQCDACERKFTTRRATLFHIRNYCPGKKSKLEQACSYSQGDNFYPEQVNMSSRYAGHVDMSSAGTNVPVMLGSRIGDASDPDDTGTLIAVPLTRAITHTQTYVHETRTYQADELGILHQAKVDVNATDARNRNVLSESELQYAGTHIRMDSSTSDIGHIEPSNDIEKKESGSNIEIKNASTDFEVKHTATNIDIRTPSSENQIRNPSSEFGEKNQAANVEVRTASTLEKRSRNLTVGDTMMVDAFSARSPSVVASYRQLKNLPFTGIVQAGDIATVIETSDSPAVSVSTSTSSCIAASTSTVARTAEKDTSPTRDVIVTRPSITNTDGVTPIVNLTQLANLQYLGAMHGAQFRGYYH